MAPEADTTDKKPNAAYDRSSLPRARSSLELLSETATIIESSEASSSAASPRDPTPPPSMLIADTSPASARITPPTATSYLPVIAETLQLPEMVSITNKAKQALHPRKEMVAVQHINYDTTTSNSNLNNAHLYLPTFAAPQELYSRNSSTSTTTTLTASGGVGVTTMATAGSSSSFALPTDDPIHEKLWLRQQMAVRDATIATLQTQVHQLQQEIRQLRQLPTGKISQIPVE